MTNAIHKTKIIAIDARVVVEKQGHGIARYADRLINELMLIANLPFEVILLVTEQSPYLNKRLPAGFSLKIMRTGWIQAIGQIELMMVLSELKPNLYHSPSFIVPVLSHIPLVATIHDLNHVVLARHYSSLHRIYYNFFLARKLRTAKAVLTISEFSRSEIVRYLKLPESHINVIYNGLAPEYQPLQDHKAPEVIAFRDQFELPERYILALGNRKPHKNMRTLTEAYCSGNFEEPLVLLSEFDPEILHIANRYHKKHQIHFLRFVPNEQLPILYALCSLFVFPSLYEGFGLPPIEAAACGVPVAVSNRTSLPEIMGTTALYFDPENVDEMRETLIKGLSGSAEVLKKIEEGLVFVHRYSWKRMAQETLNVYLKVLHETEV